MASAEADIESDRNDMLFNLSAITGLELDVCISALEDNSWDLSAAAQALGVNTCGDVAEQDSNGVVSDFESLVSNIEVCQFDISYKSRQLPISLSSNNSIGDLLNRISNEIDVPVSELNVDYTVPPSNLDWRLNTFVSLTSAGFGSHTQISISRKLPSVSPSSFYNSSSLDNTPTSSSSTVLGNTTLDMGRDFNLKLSCLDNSVSYDLKFSGDKTVAEVKEHAVGLCGISLSDQHWYGWPPSVDDDTVLGCCGLTEPVHNLVVFSDANYPDNSRPGPSNSRKTEVIDLTTAFDPPNNVHLRSQSPQDLYDDESGDPLDPWLDDVEHASRQNKNSPMIPDGLTDETAGTQMFATEFTNRYGFEHPQFYLGTLEQARREALECRARERRPLALYIHHDRSILAHVFCVQGLCASSVVDYLTHNFVIWPWDITSDENKAVLLTRLERVFSDRSVADSIRNLKTDELPLLLVIGRPRASFERMSVIRGCVTPDELLSELIQVNDIFREQMQQLIKDEDERDIRNAEIDRQKAEYEESLRRDAEKKAEKQKAEEELSRQRNEQLLREQHERELREKEKRRLESLKAEALAKLPEEPPADSPEAKSNIRFRLPAGGTITRRFLVSDPLCTLLQFLVSKGFHLDEYRVLQFFPEKKDLTETDASQTLKELKLYPTETLTIESRFVTSPRPS